MNMSFKVSCNLMVNDENDSSFLFAMESDGQLNRDVTIQNKVGNSFVVLALSTEEALDLAKQIQTQYMDYTQSVVEKQRDESKKLKEQMSRLSVESDSQNDDDKENEKDSHLEENENESE